MYLEAGQVVRYSHLLKNFPQFVVIHTVKGFGIVNKVEVDVFLELSYFLMIRRMLAIWCLVPLPFLNPAWTCGSSRFTLKPGLENFEHYFTWVWDESNCVVVWALFGIAFLWDWNENWPFQSCGHGWVFQICWHIECSTFTTSCFRIWNSSTGIRSPPLALFIVMLPQARLTSHSSMSGSRWVITPSWLSGSWKSFLYSSSGILATSP